MQAMTLQRVGCTLHYWMQGPADRPLVVFTHGAGMDHRMFDAQVEALRDRYRSLTWDVRGQGLSRPMGDRYSIHGAVDDLLAILDHIGAPPAVFVGQSMGGSIVQELIFKQPERAVALVFIGATCNTLPVSVADRLGIALAPPILKLTPHQTLLKISARGNALRPEVQRYVYDSLGTLSKAELIEILTATLHSLHHEPNYFIPHPLLLTHGEHDQAGNIKRIAPVWARREPHCRYEVIPAAGHCANQDNPEFFNHLLLEFLHEHAR